MFKGSSNKTLTVPCVVLVFLGMLVESGNWDLVSTVACVEWLIVPVQVVGMYVCMHARCLCVGFGGVSLHK